MRDRRSEDRINVDAQIDVMDAARESVLGVLMDISPGGFMVSTNLEIEIGQLFQLCLAIPGQARNGNPCSLNVGAEAMWKQAAPDGSHSWIGFQIIDISDEDSDRIDQLIDNWGN
jgi:hypothetical protein